MTNFIIADNQELTQVGLTALINKVEPHSSVIVSYKRELIEQLEKAPDSVILLDYTLFDFTDVESLLILCDRFPTSQWLLITDDLTESFMRKVICSSKNIGIIFKDSQISYLHEAIQDAVQKRRYICHRATEILIDSQLKEEPATNLTSTEIEILRSIAQGKTTKEIAAERYSSIHTINTHRKNIFKKLKVNTAHEAIKYAFRAGLVDTSEFYI